MMTDLERAREAATELWLNLGADPVDAIAKWGLLQRAEEVERGAVVLGGEIDDCHFRAADLRRQAGESNT